MSSLQSEATFAINSDGVGDVLEVWPELDNDRGHVITASPVAHRVGRQAMLKKLKLCVHIFLEYI